MAIPAPLLRAAALACAIATLGACGSKEPPPEAPRLVATHVVGAGNARTEANYSGEVKPRYETPLAFRAGGKMASRLVEVGQAVRPGQPLARLDPADLELNAGAARAQLAAAESDLIFAKAEYERYRDLRGRHFVSQAALEGKEAAWRTAKGRMEAATAQAGLARNQSAYATLAADAAGVISAVLAEPGQVVAAGQPVLRLARPGEMEVAIAVPENRVAELKAATEIRIALWAENGRTYAGRIREIAPMADPATRTYAVRVSLLAPDADVRLGMTANVFLGRQGTTAGVLVPATAVFQQDGKPAVWVVGAGNALVLRPVDIAQFREDGALVAGGLKAGERIVAAGVHKVFAGEKIRFEP
ncbi:MAG: efflux transporter, family, subunit [Rhodocyclaceae bacterium]|nr:efflux transporter, family, subunit [Rhodocyclaceae bacterium]